MSVIVAPPTRVPPLDGLPNPFAREWRNYLLVIQNVGQASPQILQEVSLVNQTTAISTTPLALPSITSGFYRVSVYYIVTIAGAVSSALTVTVGWTDASGPRNRVIPTLVNGAVGANFSIEFPIHTDDNSPITYAAAYASNAANQMTYNLGVIVEALA